MMVVYFLIGLGIFTAGTKIEPEGGLLFFLCFVLD